MSKIHLVMQGKGGVGKSLLAFYIAQYVREKNGKCLVFDTDPLNQTLARTTALEARVVRILADDHITIMKNAFDLMIEECEKEEVDVVIDVGASSFVPMLEYCAVNGVYDLWHEIIPAFCTPSSLARTSPTPATNSRSSWKRPADGLPCPPSSG